MTNMIERVARAIYQGRNGYGCRAWGSLPKLHHAPYLADAKAAIEAMREPTDDMVRHGTYTLDICMKDDPCGRAAQHMWGDMITAALSQEER